MKTILIVDDNKWLRDLLSLALTTLLDGLAVKTAENGAAAVRLFDSVGADLILTDLSMPVMDGYKLIEHVRGVRSSLVPIVVMTGNGEKDLDRLRVLGVSRWLEKPFDLHEAALEIGVILGLAESVREPEKAFSGKAEASVSFA